MSRKNRLLIVTAAMLLVVGAVSFALVIHAARERREAEVAERMRRMAESRAAVIARQEALEAKGDALIAEADAEIAAGNERIRAQVEALREQMAKGDQMAEEATAPVRGDAATTAPTRPADPASNDR